MSTLLQVKNITKIYPNQPKPGLDNVSFEVTQGEFLGIMGASGSGKTTLLNVLSTIDVPTNGHIVMGKIHIEKLGQRQAADFRKNNLGFIFQEWGPPGISAVPLWRRPCPPLPGIPPLRSLPCSRKSCSFLLPGGRLLH